MENLVGKPEKLIPLDADTLNRLMESFNLSDLHDLNIEVEVVELHGGELLFEQGDEGDSMYLLLAGVLGVRVQHEDGTQSEVDRLAPGAFVGEMALLTGRPRTATVFAVNDAGLLRITKDDIEKLSLRGGDVLGQIAGVAAQRAQRLQLLKILKKLLGDLDTIALHALYDQLEWQHASNGDVIMRQGDESDSLYIVINGRLRVSTISPEGEESALGEIGAGEPVGEFALLTGSKRTATVFAIRETNLVRMTPPLFEKLLAEYPKFLPNITRNIVERQQRLLNGQSMCHSQATTFTIIPHTADIKAGIFVQELAAALEHFGSALILDRQGVDLLYGQPGAADCQPGDFLSTSVLGWLSEQEVANDYIVYLAEPSDSPWTRRCISQADRVLLLVELHQDTNPSQAEMSLQDMKVPVRSELLIWHPKSTEIPVGTAEWLQDREVQIHHHIKKEDGRHMGRLARWLTGRTIGLVLSGGAARGFAHLGGVRALEELDIPIDYYGGTSMGALIAAGLANGERYESARKLAQKMASRKSLLDYTLPITSVMASKKVTRVCKELFEERRIEDLWIPFFCVSTNLSRAEPMIHREGPLWFAARASIAIPGIFSPIMYEGEVLVDGGVMNNFPVNIMANIIDSDHILGIHASPHRNVKKDYDLDGGISGWRILFSRISPFSKSIRSPSLAGTILRTLEINSVYRGKADKQLADLVIHPDVRRFGILDFEDYEPIIEAGYQASIQPLRNWKARNILA